jgi:hypothetical protein
MRLFRAARDSCHHLRMLRATGHVVSSLAGLPAAATAALATLLALVSPGSADDAVAIQHQPVRCIVAGKYPQLDACFEPASRVARARVYFKAEGGPEWYYVEMKPEAQCYRGTLPPPQKSLKRMRYYVAVTDQDFAEARTEEYEASVVTSAKSCAIGGVAPYVTTATVVVSGAAALPAGFAGAGLLAGVGATTAVAGAAIVGAGAAGAVIAGGDAPDTTTTTRPPRPTTTTTTAPTTTTTTTLPGGCAADSKPPSVAFLSPRENDDVAATVSIVVEASDPGPVSHGIREVTLSAEEQGGSRKAAIATLPGPGPRFEATWDVPACEGTGDRWSIYAVAVDGCDRSRRDRVNVRRRGSNCPAAAGAAAHGPESPGLVWTSELAVGGGRGQVIANGTDVVFPGPGRSDVTLPAREGRNSIEAVLVEGDGPGTWRFTLASGAIRPGSLRVIAGEAVAVGPGTLAFRLRGRPGERAIFAFEMTGH